MRPQFQTNLSCVQTSSAIAPFTGLGLLVGEGVETSILPMRQGLATFTVAIRALLRFTGLKNPLTFIVHIFPNGVVQVTPVGHMLPGVVFAGKAGLCLAQEVAVSLARHLADYLERRTGTLLLDGDATAWLDLSKAICLPADGSSTKLTGIEVVFPGVGRGHGTVLPWGEKLDQVLVNTIKNAQMRVFFKLLLRAATFSCIIRAFSAQPEVMWALYLLIILMLLAKDIQHCL